MRWITMLQKKIRSQGLAECSHHGFCSSRYRLPLDQKFLWVFQNFVENRANPGLMDRGKFGSAFKPVLIRLAQTSRALGIATIEPLRENSQQHRQREERSGGFNKGEPFRM